MLKAMQHGFYVENRDISQTEVMAELAETVGLEGARFRAEFEDTDTMDETRNDFWLAKNTGVGGFPTLVAFDGGQAQAVTIGYSPWEDIGPALRGWLRR